MRDKISKCLDRAYSKPRKGLCRLPKGQFPRLIAPNFYSNQLHPIISQNWAAIFLLKIRIYPPRAIFQFPFQCRALFPGKPAPPSTFQNDCTPVQCPNIWGMPCGRLESLRPWVRAHFPARTIVVSRFRTAVWPWSVSIPLSLDGGLWKVPGAAET